MNNFDIPKGTIRNGGEVADYTQWTVVADLKDRRYYVKSYDDQVLRGIDLMSFDLDAKKVRTVAIAPDLAPPALFPAE